MEKQKVYLWCGKCKHAYSEDKWIENISKCPNKRCPGSKAHTLDWRELLVDNNDYPGQPDEGVAYPRYRSSL